MSSPTPLTAPSISRRELFALASQPSEPVNDLETDLVGFNELVGPLTPNLYVFLGATGMGKTALACSIARGLLDKGSGLIVPTELSPLRWESRLLAAQTGVPATRIYDSTLTADEAQAVEAARQLADQSPHEVRYLNALGPSVSQIHYEAVRIKDLRFIMVDSFNCMRANGRSLFDRATAIADQLLALCLKLNVPVLVTAQVGRDVIERRNKKPRLDDAYGSARIEHNASVVMSLYRHDYYVRMNEAKPDPTFPKGTARLYLLKHRDGEISEPNYRDLRFLGGCGMYSLEPKAEAAA